MCHEQLLMDGEIVSASAADTHNSTDSCYDKRLSVHYR